MLSVLLHSLPYLPRAPPSGELASECVTIDAQWKINQ